MERRSCKLLVPIVEESGVYIARGSGSISGKLEVQIDRDNEPPTRVKARQAVIIATGSEPIIPDISGLENCDCWTPRDATSAQIVPRHLLIMGAGAVDSEMATAYSSFGARVTLISSSAEILSCVDPEAGCLVRQSLESKGVVVKTGTRVVQVKRLDDGSVTATLSSGEEISGSELLIAVGRRDRHKMLNLESVGAKANERWVDVEDSLTVKMDDAGWLYAVGDANGRALLTHTSKYHGRIVATAIVARSEGASVAGTDWIACCASADKFAVPQTISTDPPIASVGHTRASAKAATVVFQEITAPFLTLGAKIASDKTTEGWAQWIVDSQNRLVGATLVGKGASEVLHGSTVAVVGGIDLKRLVHAIPSLPTISEVYLNLIDAAGF